MVTLVNNVWVNTATTGTGVMTLGSALPGYQTPADAGVTNGQVVPYRIFDGAAWEQGTGTYTSAGTTLSRNVVESSNADAAINLSGTATVIITPLATQLPSESTPTDGTVDEAAYVFVLEGGVLKRYLLSDIEAALDLVDFSGTLSIAKGGTGQTAQTPAFDALSPLTTQGDILYHNGSDNVRLGPGTSGQFLKTNGAGANPAWATVASNPTLDTEQATTSGTTKDFTIPAGAKRIVVMLDGVSTNSSTALLGIQLGDSGGIETTGYISRAIVAKDAAASVGLSITSRFGITVEAGAASVAYSGHVVLTRINSSHTWICSAVISTDTLTLSVTTMAGNKTLDAELTTVRLMNSTGATFDLGAVNVLYDL